MSGAALNSEGILRLVRSSPPLIEHFRDLQSQLQPNGFDLTVREVSRFTSPGTLGDEAGQRAVSLHEALVPDPEGMLEVGPGAYLVTFNEVVNLPNHLMALGRPRSSLLRSGVAVHTAVWDAGYRGRSQALMVVYNAEGFRLALGARIVQLAFFALESPVLQGYQGIFQGENTS